MIILILGALVCMFPFMIMKGAWDNIARDNERARVKKELLARWNAASPEGKEKIRAELRRIMENSR